MAGHETNSALSLHVVRSFQEIQREEPSPTGRVRGDFLEEAVCVQLWEGICLTSHLKVGGWAGRKGCISRRKEEPEQKVLPEKGNMTSATKPHNQGKL